MIPANIILIWAGLNANIPSGWARETALDGKFPKGTANGVAPNDTGGAATHTHTSPTHSHTMVNHTHTFDTSSYNTPSGYNTGGTNNTSASDASHTHNGSITSALTGGTLSDAITYAAANNEPSHRKVIFIKPSGASATPSAGVIGLWQGASAPATWYLCDGNNDTPDLRNRYLKGAATGADADLSDLGSLTHTHDVSHTHAAVNHSHTATTSAANTQARYNGGTNPNTFAAHQHTHPVTMANVSEAGQSYSGSVVSDTVEPLYKKLSAIQASIPNTPKNIIGMWLGALASIPIGWVLCDGNNGTIDMRSNHLKIANAFNEAGNAGGSNTHSHSASNSHTHTAAGTHNHTGSSTDNCATPCGRDGSGDNIIFAHLHTLTNVQSQTSSWNNATISGDSVNSEPAYRTVAFIQLQKIYGGAAGIIAAI